MTAITPTAATAEAEPSSPSSPAPVARRRKFLVVTCDDSDKWKGFDTTFQTLFGDAATDEWKFIEAITDPLPTNDEIMEYDGIVLPGSKYTTYEDDQYPWIKRLHDFIRRIDHIPATAATMVIPRRAGRAIDGPRVVGICFGAQSIAHSLGGRVDRNVAQHFAVGAEPVTTNDAFDQLISELGVTRDTVRFVSDRTLRVLESHFDSVQQLPPHATVLATSPSAPFEVYSVAAAATATATAAAIAVTPTTTAATATTTTNTTSTHGGSDNARTSDIKTNSVPQRFIGIQGHPEFTPSLIEQQILPHAIESGAVRDVNHVTATMKQDLSSDGVLAILRAFIRS